METASNILEKMFENIVQISWTKTIFLSRSDVPGYISGFLLDKALQTCLIN